MDPLTSAVCTLGEIREMCSEMLEAERAWLPNFAGKVDHAQAGHRIPPGCQPVDVPLDPALAIGKRFGTLVITGI
jgi:alpha-galactosidase